MATQKERSEAIVKTARSYGFPIDKNHRLISFWELADQLNNNWEAKHFCPEKYCSKRYVTEKSLGKSWAIDNWELWVFRRMIRWTIKRMSGATIYDGYPKWYKIKVQ